MEGVGVKGQKGTLDNSTVTSSSANVGPNPGKQRAQLTAVQFDFGKKTYSHSELCLVPLEATIAASQEVACVLKCHHCAACTYCAVVILSPLWGYLAVDCMIRALAEEPSLDFYTVVCTQFVVQTDTLKPFSSLTLVT